jgi:ribosomal protein S18 acetylase RimI-like enzyme
MSNHTPIILTPVRIAPGDAEFQSIQSWPFADQPFYEGQVNRLLQQDIPQRAVFGLCAIWSYRDTAGNAVGFGTLEVCREYEQFTGGKLHSYIPLLAVNPAYQRLGHGRRIVEHLIAEAALIAQSPGNVADLLFLDVYAANQAAIALYQKSAGSPF